MTPKEYANCLRQAADFYDSVGYDFPIPDGHLTKSFYFTPNSSKEMVTKIARVFGSCEKSYNGSLFELYKDFDGVKISFIFGRDSVCEKRVVGTKEVPSCYIPSHIEEIVEWDCKSILSEEDANALHQAAGPKETSPSAGENNDRDEGRTHLSNKLPSDEIL